jgi:hypothetical protein
MGYIAAGLYSVAIVLFIFGSTGLQFWGVLQEETRDHTQDWMYLVPAALMNIVVIMFILFPLMKSKIFGTVGKTFAVFLLLGGFLAETMLTTLYYSEPEVYAVYAVLGMNFIIRLTYFVILRLSLGVDIAKSVEEAAKLAKVAQLEAAKKQVAALASSLGLTATVTEKKDEKKSDSGSSSASSSSSSGMIDEWQKVRKGISEKNSKKLTSDSINKAFEIVKKAANSGRSKSEAFSEARAALRRDDGASVVFGGRRR